MVPTLQRRKVRLGEGASCLIAHHIKQGGPGIVLGGWNSWGLTSMAGVQSTDKGPKDSGSNLAQPFTLRER